MDIDIIEQERKVINKWIALQNSAFSRNKDFNLTLQSVKNLLGAKKCYYTGIPLTDKNFSIDRIDNDKGYVIGNVCACDVKINQLKSTLTRKDIEKLLKKMK